MAEGTSGVLRSDEGPEYILDGPLILGREEPPASWSGGVQARWCPVGGSNPAVSRSHLEVRADGPHVTVVDLDSTNGTVLELPDGTSLRLPPQVPATLPPGAVLVLGGAVRVRYDPTEEGRR